MLLQVTWSCASLQIPIIDGIVQAAAVSHLGSMLDAQNVAFVAVLGAAGSKYLAHTVVHPTRLVRHLAHSTLKPLCIQPSYHSGHPLQPPDQAPKEICCLTLCMA